MYSKLIFFLVCLIFTNHSGEAQSIKPAEWENQQAVFVNYSGTSRDKETSQKVQNVCIDIIKELSAVTTVYVLINEEYNQDSLQNIFRTKKIQTKNVRFLPVYELFSMGVPRDYGPIIVKDKNGQNRIIRFHWDYVGADFVNPNPVWSKKRDLIRDKYYDQVSKLLKMEVQSVPIAIEGGEIEVNGKGTALMVESFTLPRNPSLNRTQIDSALSHNVGVKNVIWLKEGVAEDPGAGRKSNITGNIYGYGVGGHIDEVARFVDSNTIFLAMPSKAEAASDPVKKITYDRMQVNDSILRQSSDQDGNKLNIIHFPVPDVIPEIHVVDKENLKFPVKLLIGDFPEWKQGDTIRFMPAASYLNFLIFNQLVLIPKYWRPGFPESCKEKDALVKKLFREHFPKKKIVQIDTWGMNLVGGGIHCWTQQVPID